MKNFSWMVADRIVTMLSSMFIGVWMIRTLGPADFGIYSYALAYHSLFHVTVVWGLPTLLVKNLVKHPLEKDQILGAAFYVHTFGAVMAMALMFATAHASQDEGMSYLLLTLALTYPFTIWSILDAQYQVRQQRERLAQARMFSTGLGAFLKILCILNGAELFYYALVLSLENVLICFFIYVRHGEMPWGNRAWHWPWVRRLLDAGAPLFIQSIFILLIYRCDQFLIEYWLNKEALGEYVMGRKLPDAWCFIPGLVITTLYPKLEQSGLAVLWARVIRGLLMLSAITALVVMTFQDSLYHFVYGISLSDSALVMTIQFWVVMFSSLSMLSSRYFVSQNLQRHLMARTFVGLCINMIFNIILIPRMGIVGAAIATLMAEMYMATWSCCWSAQTRGFFRLILRAIHPFDRLRS